MFDFSTNPDNEYFYNFKNTSCSFNAHEFGEEGESEDMYQFSGSLQFLWLAQFQADCEDRRQRETAE